MPDASEYLSVTMPPHLRLSPSIMLRNKPPLLERLLIVIRMFHRPRRQLHFRPRHLLVRNLLEQVPDAVQPRPLLVIAPQDVPWGVLAVGRLEHQVPRPRILVPPRS